MIKNNIPFPPAEQILEVPAPPYAFVRIKGSAEFDLNAYAKKFNDEFQEFRGSIFIMGENGVIAEKLDPSKKDLLESLSDSTRTHSITMYDEKSPLPYLAFKYALIKFVGAEEVLKADCDEAWVSVHKINSLIAKEAPAQYLHLAADHEVGHALCHIGQPWHLMKHLDWENLSECQADAYATIRHFQAYGKDSPFPALWSDLRTARALAGDITHWTSRAIKAVIDLNGQGALEKMTPQESRDLAVKIARETALTPDERHHIKKHLGADWPDDDYMLKNSNLPKYCASISSATKSPIVHQLMAQYLNILEKYDVFPSSQIRKAREELANKPAATHESLRPVWKRLKEHWDQRKYNMDEVPHAPLAKPPRPPQR